MKHKYYIQYHNADKLGYYPTLGVNFKTIIDSIVLDNTIQYDSRIYTAKKQIEKAVGAYCFLIVGKSDKTQKSYYLWSFFQIDDFNKDKFDFYNVNGTGYNFTKPICLNKSKYFDDFKKFCGNFGLGFQNIDNHNFCQTLVELSSI